MGLGEGPPRGDLSVDDGAVTALDGVGALADRYRTWLVDAWGVLHDGVTATAEAVDCLRRLVDCGGRVVVLSNAARRTAGIEAELANVGIGRDCYTDAISSGQLAWEFLSGGLHDLGRRCFYLGPARSRALLDDLPGIEPVSLERADFVLNAGAEGNPPHTREFAGLLARLRARGMPMLCANPDQVAIRGGVRGISAGAIAADYAALGGRVIAFGKPHAAMYEAVAARVPDFDRGDTVAVGDGLDTDMRGAGDFGIDAIFVTSGIHREALGGTTVEALCRRHGVAPRYAIERLCW